MDIAQDDYINRDEYENQSEVEPEPEDEPEDDPENQPEHENDLPDLSEEQQREYDELEKNKQELLARKEELETQIDELSMELDNAFPIDQHPSAALQDVDPKFLTELKSLAAPPSAVKEVGSGVMI